MESPVKMATVSTEPNKENWQQKYLADEIAIPIKGIPTLDDEPCKDAPVVAPTIKEDEAVEPILQENAQRFVLFPIKYHEVRVPVASTRTVDRLTRLDLANVQKGRGVVLDGRGN